MNNEKVKLPLAKGWQKVLAKFFDLLFVIAICIGLSFIIFNNDNLKKNYINSVLFFVYTLLIYFIFIVYFIVIPYFLNKTLFMFFFILRYYSIHDENYYFANKIYYWKLKKIQNSASLPKDPRKKINFLINLIKRDFLIWHLLCILSLILGIIIASLGDYEGYKFIKSLFVLKISDQSNNFSTYSSIILALYSLLIAVNIFLVLNTFFCSKRKSFLDSLSNILIVSPKPIKEINDKKKNNDKAKTKRFECPGEMDLDKEQLE